MATGELSRLLFDLERLPGNDDYEDKQGFSFMPKYAVSHDKQIIQIRNTDKDYLDPNYLTYLNKWTTFSFIFEEKVNEILKKKLKYLFIIALHSFSEDYIQTKFSHYKNRKCPDINISLSNKIPLEIKMKIKRKIYQLDHKYHFKVSFNFPYNDTYETLNKNFKNIYCLTIELNKKIYLDNILKPLLKKDNTILKKYLDDFFIFLQTM